MSRERGAGSGLLEAQPSWLGPLALATVYVVWGSTYLAIRVMVETIPPLLGVGIRFVAAGSIMYGFLRWRSGPAAVKVSRSELAAAALVGLLLVGGGNGLLTAAEQEVPSGFAALLVASVPLWVVLLRAGDGETIPRSTLVGVGLGFAGVAVLLLAGERPEAAPLGWSLIVVAAAFAWASGSFVSGRLELPEGLFLSLALQMICGGVITLVLGVAVGELGQIEPAAISLDSALALAYLITAGSLAAYTAYGWLLKNVALSVIATYAYVNPVIAVALGWVILSEEVTPWMGIGTVIVVCSVALVVSSGAERRPAAPTSDGPAHRSRA